MSENSHIDKIFKDGLGERNFAGVDAMWQKMETELDRDDRSKRRPVFYLFAGVALFTAGLFTFFQLSEPRNPYQGQQKLVTQAGNIENKTANAAQNTSTVKDNDASGAINNTSIDQNNISIADEDNGGRRIHTTTLTRTRKHAIVTLTGAAAEDNTVSLPAADEMALNDYAPATENNVFAERMYAGADLISSSAFKKTLHATIAAAPKPVLQKAPVQVKKEMPKPQKISVEVVAGRDFLRMNRKAGSYVGVRINRLLDNGTAITFGLNYATHIVFDSYRIASKPSDQKMWDARLNNIASIRMPVYLQRQMGASKFSMMLGLVPTYITHAEVYNVPDSYAGNPEPYRKFTLNDINRFNVLFGAGLKYSPTKWVAVELSGSYSLTGMVKDGYKNQSRVNDNFKSIQAGFAFRLK